MQAESIDDLIERSSLGTTAGRRLRNRTLATTVAAVRFKAGITSLADKEPRRFTMPTPNDRYVVRSPDGGWDVKAAHAKRSSKHTQTQSEAIQYAKDIVRNAGGGEMRIQGRDRRSRDSDTVAPGNDPTHPRTPGTEMIDAQGTAIALDEHVDEPVPVGTLEASGGQPLQQRRVGPQPRHRHRHPPRHLTANDTGDTSVADAGLSQAATMAPPKAQESRLSGPTIVGGAVEIDTSSPQPDATMESPEWDPTWPNADIIVLPGIPGWTGPNANQDVPNPHPAPTTDFVKVLSGAGFDVQYITARNDRSVISINAAESWVPILAFALQDAACVPSEILIAAIRQVFGSWLSDQSRLHVRFKQKNLDGTVHEFESHGRAKDVLDAMRTFGETHKPA